MHRISRRQAVIGLSSSLPFCHLRTTEAFASTDPKNGRIAIVDTADDASRYAERLKNESNVAVVARYYARARQDGLINKRIAYNSDTKKSEGNSRRQKGPSEIELLFYHGLAMLSVYQYKSHKPHKFLFGIDKNGQFNSTPPHPPIRMAEEEAKADSDAANRQAHWLDQPAKAPIYFGLDFNLIEKDAYASHMLNDRKANVVYPGTSRPVANELLIEACHTYFSTLKKNVAHPLGIYGNGFANRYMRKHALANYSWVSESRSFDQTAEFLADETAEDQWHLFQHHIDRRWYVPVDGCTDWNNNGFDIDGNVQNPKYLSIGAWHAKELRDIEPMRTEQIFNERWVTHKEMPVYFAKNRARLSDVTRCRQRVRDGEFDQYNKNRADLSKDTWDFFADNKVGRNRAVRILPNDLPNDASDQKWCKVDVNEDGEADGYCLREDLVGNIKRMRPYNR